MKIVFVLGACNRGALALSLLLLCCARAGATDWPQYRGPAADGSSPDLISTNWPASGPTVVWTNMSLTNGFSCFAVSQGRAFTMISRKEGTTNEYCVGVDAATGTTLWATPIDRAPWDPNSPGFGGSGAWPYYYKGDGPRTTPSVKDGRVFALSGLMHLVCLNATNGAVIWSNDLVSAYGATPIYYENGASPCLDNDLLFVNLTSSTNNQNLVAFRTDDGSVAWSSQAEYATHVTPVVATIQGVRQVIFATRTGLVALDRSTGAFLWNFTYPFGPIPGGGGMGASPVVYSNIVFCTAAYGTGGGAAAEVTFADSTWTVTQLYYNATATYKSVWSSPVCYQGFLYMPSGFAHLTAPLSCIELSTGNLMWSTNNFGLGGLILVNTNLLGLTEKGDLVLVQPNPNAYVELARCQAFLFTNNAFGKCWNNPTFSDGRIYARSTRGGICVDVSVQPSPPPLKLLAPQFVTPTQLQLVVATADGTPLASDRLPKIEMRTTNVLGSPPSTWPKLTNQMVLATNGVARLTNTISPGQSRQFYRAIEQP